MPRYRPLAERFWEKVDMTGECWEWTAYRDAKGYGRSSHERASEGRSKSDRAHRIAWLLSFGPVPPDMCVLHRCDNRACCRPTHLFLGTQVDNIADMDAKGRRRSLSGDDHPARRPGARTGERNGRAHLTASDIPVIRSLAAQGMMQRDIAARYGVAQPTINHVLTGKNWSHVR